VEKSLGLLHRKIDYPWTIADLASEVGLSRSALVERFTRYLSEPPMTYLTRRRLQLAARALDQFHSSRKACLWGGASALRAGLPPGSVACTKALVDDAPQ